jgi:hypothetical protein
VRRRAHRRRARPLTPSGAGSGKNRQERQGMPRVAHVRRPTRRIARARNLTDQFESDSQETRPQSRARTPFRRRPCPRRRMRHAHNRNGLQPKSRHESHLLNGGESPPQVLKTQGAIGRFRGFARSQQPTTKQNGSR